MESVDLNLVLVTLFGLYILAEVVAVVILYKNRNKLKVILRNALGVDRDAERLSQEIMTQDYERMHQALFRADVDRKLNKIGRMLKNANK
jgi:hypothetical protein